jgi:hypothetical protein
MRSTSSASSDPKEHAPKGSGFLSALKEEAAEQLEDSMKGSTWNGDVNWATMGSDFHSAFVEMDYKAVRKVASELFQASLVKTFAQIDSLPSTEARAQAWTLFFRWMFYLRKIRGVGKGERSLFYQAFHYTFAKFPQTCIDLLPLLWDYGYGGDLMALLVESSKDKTKSALTSALLSEYCRKLDLDLQIVTGKSLLEVQVPDLTALIDQLRGMTPSELTAWAKDLSGTLSLAGKWLPSEGHSKDKKAGVSKLFVPLFFPGLDLTSMFLSKDSSVRLAGLKKMNYGLLKLRKIKTLLNIVLDTPQVKMCDGRWSQLRIEALSSLTMHKFSKAFLNEKKDAILSEADAETGNRFPDSQDRIECRQHTIEAATKGALNGAVLGITDLADKICACFKQGYGSSPSPWTYPSSSRRLSSTQWSVDPSKMSTSQRQIFNVQWQKALEEVQRIIQEAKDKALADGTPLEQLELFQNALMVVDVSGSMFSANVGTKAVGLGIMGAMLSKVLDVVVTFSEDPMVIDFTDCVDIVDRFSKVLNSPWGYSTDADKVYQLVLKIAKDAASKAGTSDISGFLPGAVCMLTDGQFNGGSYSYNGGMCPNLTDKTLLQRTQAYLAEHAPGVPIWRSIFWNLNGDAPGFPATTGADNVQLVSGYSQTLFKQVLVGDYELEVDPETGVAKVKVDPWTTFLKAMEDPELVLVLEVLSRSQEGVLKHYTLPGSKDA